VRDAAHMLQEGIPSVVLVHEHFENLARKELRLLGIEDSSNIVIPYTADRPVTDSIETVLLKAREQVDKLEGMLTSQKWQPERPVRVPPSQRAPGTGASTPSRTARATEAVPPQPPSSASELPSEPGGRTRPPSPERSPTAKAGEGDSLEA
jgi:hypothetical protein